MVPADLPWWKRWLSWLFEWHIESAPSEINPHLYVSLSKGRYQLSTAKAIYSFDDLYDNFTGIFQRFDFERLPGDKVLILGLGLGSVPYMLEHTFGRAFDYTAVEIDEHVIYLANKYSLDRIHSPIEVFSTDARTFVAQCTDEYSMVVMDIFLDDVIPLRFEQVDFLEDIAKLISPGGVLLYNRLASQSEDVKRNEEYLERVFLPVFTNGTYLEVKGNWILLSDRNYLK